MKIRGRLIIAFLFVTIFPLALIAVSYNMILTNQASTLEDDYQSDISSENLLLNPIHILSTATMTDFRDLVHVADTNPDLLIRRDYLDKINSDLSGRFSFIVVHKGGQEFYIGNTKAYHQLNPLPGFRSFEEGYTDTISIDNGYLVKQKDFYLSSHEYAQLFLVTDYSEILPRWRELIRQLMISGALILLGTAALLVVWLYNGIVRPLNILQIATMQIGAGNLDTPVRVNSTDEIGELCRDFEEMRIRLKEMIQERIRYEQDTRDMMSNMAHDLQTPLTSIKGYSEGILDGVANTPEKQEKYLRTISSKANDMSYLVDQLSIFSKVEQNSLPYHFLDFPLDSYFTDCIEAISLDMETKHITMHYENTCPKDTKIHADPEQLKRVVINIINNAVKYLDRSEGNIRIRLSEVPVKQPSAPLYRQLNPDGTPMETNSEIPVPEHFIQIEIQDDGPGIDAEALPHIFQRFYRADASRGSSKRGSGLGLAIVARIIEDHGGRVWADSTPGEGTSIYFTLKETPQTDATENK